MPLNPLTLPVRPGRLLAGCGLALAIVGLIGLLLWSITLAAGTEGPTMAIDLGHLVRMTALQASLTTLLSLVVGIALAWSLNRLSFPGRGLVVGLFASAIVTPGLVVAFGLLSIWGRNGWLNQLLGQFGWGLPGSVFGLGGILLAHVILDAAFVARIVLARLDTIPQDRLKLGNSLGLSAARRFTLIDWPAIAPTLPGLCAIVFLLAFTSFPIVLLLGGGPANQTLEVAIYSAVRLDFDLGRAVQLALVQIGICSAVILLSAFAAPVPSSLTQPRRQIWFDGPGARAIQAIVLLACLAVFALPLVSVLIDGARPATLTLLARPAFWQAAFTSFWIGSASAALALALALVLVLSRAATPSPVLRVALGVPPYVYLAIPAVVLGLGFFLATRSLGLFPEQAAPFVVVLGNALLALPFAVATLAPPLQTIAQTRGRLIRSLGLSGWSQFSAIEWPLIRRDVGVVIALAFCFSLGDLGIISLFGTENFTTLPLLMARALGNYRANEAAAVAALMLVLSLAAFTGLPRLFEPSSEKRTPFFRLAERSNNARP